MGLVNFKWESQSLREPGNYDLVIGVDEAGRGPLAGPVVAGAFCFFTKCVEKATSLPEGWPWTRVGDSKVIGEEEREYLFDAFIRVASGEPPGDQPTFRRLRQCVKESCTEMSEDSVSGTEGNGPDSEAPVVKAKPKATVKPKAKKSTTRPKRTKRALLEAEDIAVKSEKGSMDAESEGSDVKRSLRSTAADGRIAICKEEQSLLPKYDETDYDGDVSEFTEGRRASIVEALADLSTLDESKSTMPTEAQSLPSTSAETLVSEKDVQARRLEPPLGFAKDSHVLFAYSASPPEEIDRVNILEATMRSMSRAVYKVLAMALPRLNKTKNTKVKVYVDGNRKPHLMEPGMLLTLKAPVLISEGDGITQEQWADEIIPYLRYISNTPMVKGDALVASISAASIVAKVVRDRIMRTLDTKFPEYLLSINKGYPTPEHQAIVRKIGPSCIHRLSFAPTFQLLKDKKLTVPEGRDFDEILVIKSSKKKRPVKAAGAASKRARKAVEQ